MWKLHLPSVRALARRRNWWCSKEVQVPFVSNVPTTTPTLEDGDAMDRTEENETVGLYIGIKDLEPMIGFNCSVDLYTQDAK